MEPTNALAQLKDIHLPDPVSWWPLAIGWWVLISLGACVLALLLWWLWQYYRAGAAKREALRLLACYEVEAQTASNTAPLCAQVSELLRRVAIAYYPREKAAALSGREWTAFLNTHSKGLNFNAVQDLLIEKPYQAEAKDPIKPLISRSRQWIKQRRRPCSV